MTEGGDKPIVTRDTFPIYNRCIGCGNGYSSAGPCTECGAIAQAGEFHTTAVLAQTSHSRMYLAQDAAGNRVALKELLFALAPSIEALEQFEREAKVLQSLNHPQIPRFVSSFRVGTGPHVRLYLAQEYVQGESLASQLSRQLMNEEQSKKLLSQILDILTYLHERVPPVLHRDIKPSNLICSENGTVYLVDFGTARELSHGTMHGATLVGTFGYMPREQLGGTASTSADLYALGATLLHLMTGRAPADLVGESYTLQVPGTLPVSSRFRWILAKLVAPRRADRFESAREVSSALATRAASVTGMPLSLARAPSARPKDFQIDESSESLTISWRWFSTKWIATLPFTAVWLGFLVFWFSAGGFFSPAGRAAWLHAAVGVGLSYRTLAALLNTTQITLSQELIKVRHGPIPWLGNRTQATADIRQLYCTSEQQGSRSSSKVLYSLHAICRDGTKITLLRGLDEAEKALWLEQAIERKLLLPDEPVDGELATRG